MIKINNLNKQDFLFFIKVLENYIEVVKLHTASAEDYKIQKSVAKTLIKHCKGKFVHTKTNDKILWQFNEYQAIVFCNSLLCYKSSALKTKEDLYTANLFLNNLNHQLKYYEKARS